MSALAHRGEYNVTQDDPLYGRVEPWEAEPCRCESPNFVRDDDDVRCWKCGKRP